MNNKKEIFKNKKDEWYTPKEWVDYVRNIYGKITLDPATNKELANYHNIKNYYDIETNGLTKSWQGHIVWLNPPFSNKNAWMKKAREEVEKGNCKIFMLLPMSLEIKAVRDYLLKKCRMHIPMKRIPFIDGNTHLSTGSVPFTSVIFEIGKLDKVLSPNTYAIYELTKEPNNEYVVFETNKESKDE